MQRPLTTDRTTLVFYAIFEHPLDFPGHVVMRRQYVRSTAADLGQAAPLTGRAAIAREPELDPIAGLYPDVAAARRDVPRHAWRFERMPEDVHSLVESWMT